MKKLLVLGAGRCSSFLIPYLLDSAVDGSWFVTVGDLDPAVAREIVGDHSRGEAIRFDVNDAALRSAEIEKADLVINMLPAAFQDLVAWDCVNHGRHMISVSYRDQTVRDLDLDAKRRGVLLLCEMGLDPGIDHMSAIALIRRIESDGGRIVEFRSYGSGIPAPNQEHNPLRYVLTWDPRNVVMAGFEGAQYMEEGETRIVPYHHVFQRTWQVEVDGVGKLEAYANRDSMSYMQSFGLHDVRTMIRGTLRWPGWSETWSQVVRLGLPNETLRIKDLPEHSYREVVRMFLPPSASGADLERRVASYLRINPTGRIMDNLRWLGLFSEERIGCRGDTAAAMLEHLLKAKLPLTPDVRDMVVLVHEIETEHPDPRRGKELWNSSLIVTGDAGGPTAMSRTVGLPVALAARLVLRGELPLTGSVIPTHPTIVDPILRELRTAGLEFVETRRASETQEV